MLRDNQISIFEKNIKDLSDTPSSDGISAAQLKEFFDGRTDKEIKNSINGIINALIAATGASEIGAASISGLAGTNVQTLLEALKGKVDDVYNKSATDEKLRIKADQATVDETIKSVSFDADTGKLSFVKVDGSSFIIDTMLEKIITNFSYDTETQSIVFTASDGTSSRVSIAEFVTVNEFLSGDQVQFSVENGVVTATIKNGSITETMISAAYREKLEEYVRTAGISAENASASEMNAMTYRDEAMQSRTAAKTSQDAAKASENAASEKASDAEASGKEAKSYAVGQTGTRDGEDADNAKYYKEQAVLAKQEAEAARDEARQIVGGDYVTTAKLAEHTGNSNVHVSEEEKQAWNNKVDAQYVEQNGGKIDAIKVNGSVLEINDKQVNISVPTKTSDIENDMKYVTEDSMNEAVGNISSIVVSDLEPEKADSLWIDTANGGIAKYYNSSDWVPIASVWG